MSTCLEVVASLCHQFFTHVDPPTLHPSQAHIPSSSHPLIPSQVSVIFEVTSERLLADTVCVCVCVCTVYRPVYNYPYDPLIFNPRHHDDNISLRV